MIELEEPFLRLAAGSGKGITAEIVFSVRIPVSSSELARVGLHHYFVDAFKLLGIRIENCAIIEPDKVQFLLSTDKFKIEPRFLSSDILKSNKQTLLR